MMREEDRTRIKELLGQIECPKGFECAASGFRYMCKASKGDSHCEILCLEDNPDSCVFVNAENGKRHCDCPLRRYICERLGL